MVTHAPGIDARSTLNMRITREHSLDLWLRAHGEIDVMAVERGAKHIEIELKGHRPKARGARSGHMILTIPIPQAERLRRLLGVRLKEVSEGRRPLRRRPAP